MSGTDPVLGATMEIAKILVPEMAKNHKKIGDYISRQFRRITKGSICANISIYVTTFSRFKVGYTLEDVNQHLCNTLSAYRISGQQDDRIKYNSTEFDIAIEYDYSENVYATNEILDHESPLGSNTDDEIVIPAVVGVSFYLFPKGENTRTQLLDAYCFIEVLENKMLEYHIVQKGSFLYIMTESQDDKLKIMQLLIKRVNEWHGSVKNLSSKHTEIKLKLDKLMAKTIGEML